MARDFTQSSEQFLASLDAEIERLQQMRQQVAAALGLSDKTRKTGRPKGRVLSAEARARIAAAQKARWVKQKRANKKTTATAAPAKKAAIKKTVAKSTPVKSAEA